MRCAGPAFWRRWHARGVRRDELALDGCKGSEGIWRSLPATAQAQKVENPGPPRGHRTTFPTSLTSPGSSRSLSSFGSSEFGWAPRSGCLEGFLKGREDPVSPVAKDTRLRAPVAWAGGQHPALPSALPRVAARLQRARLWAASPSAAGTRAASVRRGRTEGWPGCPHSSISCALRGKRRPVSAEKPAAAPECPRRHSQGHVGSRVPALRSRRGRGLLCLCPGPEANAAGDNERSTCTPTPTPTLQHQRGGEVPGLLHDALPSIQRCLLPLGHHFELHSEVSSDRIVVIDCRVVSDHLGAVR